MVQITLIASWFIIQLVANSRLDDHLISTST